MIIGLKHRKMAQSTLEYAVLISALSLAILAMQVYVKRSIQGRVRDAADEIGEQYSAKTTTSKLTQNIINPTEVITKGKPKFITVEITDPVTGAKRSERREIMEIERTEPTTITIDKDSYEKTGTLAEEGGLFGDNTTTKK